MDRPMLFKDEMVRAILEGRKTQTRRIVKHKYPQLWGGGYYPTGKVLTDLENQPGAFMEFRHETQDEAGYQGSPASALVPCPYGQPGDRLWVREKFATHFIWDDLPPGHIDIQHHSDGFFYADGTITSPGCEDHQRGKWRPSIHMPRWASRITLEITDVRVERLQDISGEDSAAEGVTDPIGSPRAYGVVTEQFAREQFGRLWQSINGRESWDANPWVWVIEFRRAD